MDWITKDIDVTDSAEVENITSRIEKAEELIKEMDEQRVQIIKKVEENKNEENRLTSLLRDLSRQSDSVREDVALNATDMSWVKQELDKVVFANNAYRDKSLISNSTGQEINIHNLHFLILHGTKNLVGQRRFFKTIKENKKNGYYNSSSTVDNLKGIGGHYWHPKTGTDGENEVLKDIRILESEWEKGFANTPVKGRSWNSLGSKQDLQDQIKLMEEESSRLRKTVLEIRPRTKQVNKDLGTTKQESTILNSQWLDICRRRYKENLNKIELKKELDTIFISKAHYRNSHKKHNSH